MWKLPFLSITLALSHFRGHASDSSSNNQPTPANGLGTGEAFAAPKTNEFEGLQPSVASASGNLISPHYLDDNGYTDTDLYGGVIGIYNQRYHQDKNEVLQLYIDPETQVITIFENNLNQERLRGKGRRLELHEVIQALFSKRDMDITTIKWVATLVDQAYTLKTINNYRKKKNLSPQEDLKITPTDYSWHEFSDLRYYKSISQIVPGAQVDRIISKYQDLPKLDVSQQPLTPEVMALSFNMPPNGDSDAIDPIDENAARLAAEDNLNAGLEAANAALMAYTKNIWKIVDELENQASNPTPGPA
ncbi:hypothetical protein Cpir12675_006283 [Ceratocystis pirilliformis]|uniref:Uncharacterized protein n=1 Tax=Ceratocystis pirilliformis TaxID=259994 RepID=A0ABR3YJT3_9PEZI